jgi:hypothetical protein
MEKIRALKTKKNRKPNAISLLYMPVAIKRAEKIRW